MDKKMTSGEIAKKAGISQKTIRLYDEKGLLKPSEYSEGNYRLYDDNALLVLEKIIALKQVGLSLEEIKEHLLYDDNDNILEVLNQQLQMMEQKRYEIEKSITCIKNAITRSGDEANWDIVADVIRTIQKDQKADEIHWYALEHCDDDMDWYVKIYNTLHMTESSKVLDLGCGYSKLWRNNWEAIPQNTQIYAYDLHGSWAEDFSQFVNEHSERLSDGTGINVIWGDVEEADTWKNIEEEKTYSLVIAHYLGSFLKNEEKFFERVADVLADDGMFSITGTENAKRHFCIKEIFDRIGLNTKFIDERIQNNVKRHNEFESVLKKYFSHMEVVPLYSGMAYDNSEEAFDFICNTYPEQSKYLMYNSEKIKMYFDVLIKENGKIILQTEKEFWHCYK